MVLTNDLFLIRPLLAQSGHNNSIKILAGLLPESVAMCLLTHNSELLLAVADSLCVSTTPTALTQSSEG